MIAASLMRTPWCSFVAVLQAAQDGDGVFDGRLGNQHGLEAALERRVLFDVLAVFVERGGADGAQLAAGQRRLEHVGGVHRAFGRAGADQGVQFVDEQDDLAGGFGHFLQHGLQAILEFAAILRAGHQRGQVQRHDALGLEHFRHVAGDDALRQAFHDGRLADARLADQHRIVLGAARQNLHHAADFVVAADDRIELAAARRFGQVARILLQRAECRSRDLPRSRDGCRAPRPAPAESLSRVAPCRTSNWPAGSFSRPAMASRMCSVETNSSLKFFGFLKGLFQNLVGLIAHENAA